MIAGLYARGHGQAMGNSWADPETSHSCGEETPLVSDRVLGADDGIRTRDPHLGKGSWAGSSDLRRPHDLVRELGVFVRVQWGRFASLPVRSRDPDGTPTASFTRADPGTD